MNNNTWMWKDVGCVDGILIGSFLTCKFRYTKPGLFESNWYIVSFLHFHFNFSLFQVI